MLLRITAPLVATTLIPSHPVKFLPVPVSVAVIGLVIVTPSTVAFVATVSFP